MLIMQSSLGKTNQEIAEMLYIAPGTVRVHVHAILQKLDVRDRTQAAVIAIQKNLMDRALLSDGQEKVLMCESQT